MTADDIFDAGWLALREPVDHRSRAHELADRLARRGEAAGWSSVLDLGGGTGSNVRYLSPRLPWARRWTVVDHDPRLLVRTAAAWEAGPGAGTLDTVRGDLADEGLARVASCDLVTASALLDLVSTRWVEALADACHTGGTPFLAALSYDGGIRWGAPGQGSGGPGGPDAPEDPDDAFVREAVNRHQSGEKGMGAALGTRAAARTARAFRDRGWTVELRPSPWILEGREDAPLARALVAGWVEAALELHPSEEARLRAWQAAREARLASGDYRLTVGHQDLLALPPEPAP